MDRNRLQKLFSAATAGIMSGIGIGHLERSGFQAAEIEAVKKMTLGEIASTLKPTAQLPPGSPLAQTVADPPSVEMHLDKFPQ